jgi:hypothetical protein
MYQCCLRIRREVNVLLGFYVFYPFVTYLMTLPHINYPITNVISPPLTLSIIHSGF